MILMVKKLLEHTMKTELQKPNQKEFRIEKVIRKKGDDATLTAEKAYSINFTATRKKFFLSLHCNGVNSYLFVNGAETIKFKAKDSETNPIALCIASVSKEFSVDNKKKTGFYGYVYDFSVDYDAIAVDDILDIHTYYKHLMKKNVYI